MEKARPRDLLNRTKFCENRSNLLTNGYPVSALEVFPKVACYYDVEQNCSKTKRETSRCMFVLMDTMHPTKGLILYTSQVADQAGAYPCFCSMKRPGVFPLSLGWDANSSQGYTQHKFRRYPFIHLDGKKHCDSKVSCPRTQHKSDRTVRGLRSGGERTNHEPPCFHIQFCQFLWNLELSIRFCSITWRGSANIPSNPSCLDWIFDFIAIVLATNLDVKITGDYR